MITRIKSRGSRIWVTVSREECNALTLKVMLDTNQFLGWGTRWLVDRERRRREWCNRWLPRAWQYDLDELTVRWAAMDRHPRLAYEVYRQRADTLNTCGRVALVGLKAKGEEVRVRVQDWRHLQEAAALI